MTTLFTIGYQDADADRVLAALQSAGVAAVADVCAVVSSRKRGFSKSALRESLDAAGIDYRNFRDLGTPAAGRQAARAGDAAGMRRGHAPRVLRATGDRRRAGRAGRTGAARRKSSDLPVMLLPRSGRVPPPRDRGGVAAAGLYGDGLVRLR